MRKRKTTCRHGFADGGPVPCPVCSWYASEETEKAKAKSKATDTAGGGK